MRSTASECYRSTGYSLIVVFDYSYSNFITLKSVLVDFSQILFICVKGIACRWICYQYIQSKNMDFLNRFCLKVLYEDGSRNRDIVSQFCEKKEFYWNPFHLFPTVFTMSGGGPYNYNYIFKYIIIGDMGVGMLNIQKKYFQKII